MRFRDLEKETSIGWLPEDNPSSLTEWYLSVRDTPLDQLGAGDICRALRQSLFVSEVLPFAVALLKDDVLAGEQYDGELVAALAGLSVNCWQGSESLMHQTIFALDGIELLSKDADLLSDVSTLTNLLGGLKENKL